MDRQKRETKLSDKAKQVLAQAAAPPPPKRPRGRPPKPKDPPPQKPKVAKPMDPPTQEDDDTFVITPKRKAAQRARSMPRAPSSKASTAKTSALKTRSRSKPPSVKFVDETVEEVAKDLEENLPLEPTLDNIVDTLNAGLADGSLMVSGSESDEDYAEEVDAVPSDVSDDESDDSFTELGPVTSTPFSRKQAVKLPQLATTPQGRKSVGKYKLKVNVHDGRALRSIMISSKDSVRKLRARICEQMELPIPSVSLGYEAVWSKKTGNKKVLAYVTKEMEWDEFWLEFAKHVDGHKKESIADIASSVIFHNMLEGAQNVKGATPRAKDAKGGRSSTKKTDAVVDARTSAHDKSTASTEAVQVGMFCKKHRRLCYKKWDGKTCGSYLPEHVVDHADRLARGEPGVVADRVPAAMSSKLLDFVRPGRRNLAADLADAQAAVDATDEALRVPLPIEFPAPAAPVVEKPAYQGPLDYPTIQSWLKSCEDDLERGRDKHNYSALAVVFAVNGCTRIDDITRMSTMDIKTLAGDNDINITIGLINRVHAYAVEDVAKVKKKGKLVLGG
ncbi:hypothetical protein SCHPADRAFT_947561 [Schizopora paradoxa]|uniref:Uncharacterized protein n=1 Tax=Schizopora paradoxa TaxID=27342 RepID=A0A0H2RIF1_9AGAM|nr:hypothetical protein SCHPADRAFT_947561 [Schizopora paradoxa]